MLPALVVFLFATVTPKKTNVLYWDMDAAVSAEKLGYDEQVLPHSKEWTHQRFCGGVGFGVRVRFYTSAITLPAI